MEIFIINLKLLLNILLFFFEFFFFTIIFYIILKNIYKKNVIIEREITWLESKPKMRVPRWWKRSRNGQFQLRNFVFGFN